MLSIRVWRWVWVALAIAAQGHIVLAADDAPPTLVVLEVVDQGTIGEEATSERDLRVSATLALVEAARGVPGYRVLGADDVRTILEFQGTQQTLQCQEDGCLGEIGEAVKADFLLSSTVGAVGDTFVLSVRLLEVDVMTTVNRATVSLMGISEVNRAAAAAMGLLFGADLRVEKPLGAGGAQPFTLATSEAAPVKVAVLDLAASGVDSEVAGNLTRVVALELKEIQGMSVIASEDIRAMLELEAQKQLAGCGDASCLAEIGGALGVEYLISGNIGLVGDAFLVQLTLIDIQTAEIRNRAAESFFGDPAQLLGAARYTARMLVGHSDVGAGSVEVRAPMSDAVLVLDGETSALAAGPRKVAVGKHNLRVEADGFYPWISDVYLESEELARLDVQLLEMPAAWYERWWFWTGVGAVVVGASVGTFFATRDQSATLEIQAEPPVRVGP